MLLLLALPENGSSNRQVVRVLLELGTSPIEDDAEAREVEAIGGSEDDQGASEPKLGLVEP